MTHTERTYLEINVSGENAKDDALGKITDFIEQNPSGKHLLGELVWKTWYPVMSKNVRKGLLIRRKV